MESFNRVLDDVPEDSGDEELLPSRENRGEMFKKPTRRARWGKKDKTILIEAFCTVVCRSSALYHMYFQSYKAFSGSH